MYSHCSAISRASLWKICYKTSIIELRNIYYGSRCYLLENIYFRNNIKFLHVLEIASLHNHICVRGIIDNI